VNCDDVMRLCCAAAKSRFPGCDAEGDIDRVDMKTTRPAWLSGCNGSGWVAAINMHSTKRVFARYEAHGMTKGWASKALAVAMGVAIPGVTT